MLQSIDTYTPAFVSNDQISLRSPAAGPILAFFLLPGLPGVVSFLSCSARHWAIAALRAADILCVELKNGNDFFWFPTMFCAAPAQFAVDSLNTAIICVSSSQANGICTDSDAPGLHILQATVPSGACVEIWLSSDEAASIKSVLLCCLKLRCAFAIFSWFFFILFLYFV